MYAGFILIGALLGLTLALTVGLFYALSLEKGDFRSNLDAAGRELRDRLTGRHRHRPAVSCVRTVDADPRLRSLQEELRLANRFLEQERAEKQAFVAECQKASAEEAELRAALADRDVCIARLQDELREQAGRLEKMRSELAERIDSNSRLERELRDLRTEIDVLQSGVDLVKSG